MGFLSNLFGGGNSSTSTSQVTIPPEVLEEYRNVLNIANLVRGQEFQPYTGEFVAPLTQTQQAGIANINQAAGAAQPYFQGATQSLLGGASGAQPFYSSAAQNVLNAQAAAQPYQGAATQYTTGAGAAAQPLQQQSLNALAAGQAASQPLLQGSITGMQQAISAAQPYQTSAADVGLSGVASAMGTQQNVLAGLGAAQQAASPYYQATQQSMTGATLANQPFANLAAAGYAGAQGAAAPMQQSAMANLFGAQAAAQPLQGQAARDITMAQAGAQPYQQTATQLGLAGARGISPEALATQQYMSPYLESVVGSTMKNLRQQQQQEQSQLLGNQIAAGAFGGDRGRIAQANLARQQEMATGQTLSSLLNQGYGQALATAQQQQGVSLGAEQANRAAQAQAAQQMAALGQQGFGQGLAAAAQRAALAQQGFGQNITTAQQQAALGQQLYGQQMGVAQAQQGLGQQGFAQNMAQAQQNQALAQQMYSQGANTAQIQAALAAQQASQGVQLGQLQAGLGAQAFGQGAQMAQQQANVGQALFGQGATTAQQQAALAQQAYAQQMGMGQQMAAIGQQGFGQGMAAAQAQQGIGQGLYGMGAGVSQGLAGLGTGAQAAALQGGQAQLAAGQVEQQTQQAQNQALYNQFLQQQGYPFQTTQFLGNLAMGTGSLSGSTTTTTQPASFWSDKRLKDDIEPIGKTYDGQDIVRYRYKGEPATQIGLLAQDVEKKHPEAVGEAAGYKTVNYHDATDEAAARAPHKAYGGGLSPASMGGGVFREDAGQGFAVGGAPGGDDILAQINSLVNAHQGMFPYGKAGMYGTGLGKAGPYGSSLMPAPSRGLMRAEPVRQTPTYDVRQAVKDVEDITKMPERIRSGYSGIKSGLIGAPQETRTVTSPSGQTGTEVTRETSSGLLGRSGEFNLRESAPARAFRDFGDWVEGLAAPSGNARGGAIRPGLASGGMPYSEAENEYVDEDLTRPFKPQTLQPAAAPKSGQGGGMGGMLGGLGNIASLYKMGEKGLPFLENAASGLGGLFSGAGGAAGATGAAEGAAALGAAEGAAGGAAAAGGMEALLALFALSDKRAKENIEPIGELFDGQKVYRYNYKEKGLAPRKKYERGGSEPATGGDPIQDEVIHGYSRRAIEDMFNRGIVPIESGGRQFNERGEPLRSSAGATGVAQVMPRTGPEAAQLAGLEWDPQRFENDPNYNRDLGLAYFTERMRQHGDPLRAAAGYNAGPSRLEAAVAGGEDWLSRLPTETQNYVRDFVSRMGPSGLAPPALSEQALGRQAVAASAQPAGGLAPPASREAAQPEEKDWLRERLNKNEYWLVPLLTGLGTMASSPSRYLGASILQGLMGAGQAYQGQLTAEGQRARTAEETKKIAEEAQLNRERQGFTQAQTQAVLAGVASGAESPDRRTVRIFQNGRYMLIPREEFYNNPGEYQLYLAPYTPEERERLRAAPTREPLPATTPREPSTTAQPGAPTGGGEAAPDGARPDATPIPPGTVPTNRSTDPVALVTALPEETRNMADQEIRAARTLSTTDLRSAAAAIPSSQDVFTTARARAASAAGSLPDRINLTKEFMALPDEGIGSLGRANVFLTPMLSWANSTLRLFNVQDANGQLIQLNPRQLAGLETIDKDTIQTALNRQGQSGSRAFSELNAILSATPNTQMTRETVQKILAGNFMEEQRAVDLDNFANLWRSYAMRGREGAVGVSPDELRLTGPQVEREFNRLYNAQYNKEKAGIEKILDSTFRGRPLIDLIIESRGQPNQGFINYMNQNFADQGGARLLRYFYGR